MKYLFLIFIFSSCSSDKELIMKFDAAIFESLKFMEKQNDRLQIEITVDEYLKCRCDSADAYMHRGFYSMCTEARKSYFEINESFSNIQSTYNINPYLVPDKNYYKLEKRVTQFEEYAKILEKISMTFRTIHPQTTSCYKAKVSIKNVNAKNTQKVKEYYIYDSPKECKAWDTDFKLFKERAFEELN